MGISDLIAHFIQTELEEANGVLELQRSDLAQRFNCVPSQINYVLSSRFTPEQGYIVESKRGGGGYIKITKVRLDHSLAIMHIINSIGNELNPNTARILLQNLLAEGIISEQAALLISAAVSDRCYAEIPQNQRNRLRASILKQMLAALN